jgi:hypothetical protein
MNRRDLFMGLLAAPVALLMPKMTAGTPIFLSGEAVIMSGKDGAMLIGNFTDDEILKFSEEHGGVGSWIGPTCRMENLGLPQPGTVRFDRPIREVRVDS